MKITTGDLEVFKSGTVRTGHDNTIKFDLDAIWLEFTFREDSKDKEFRSDFNVSDDNKGLRAVLYNCSTLGNGNVKPLSFGHLNGRRIFIGYRASKPYEEDVWFLEYTFYLGGKVSE